MSMPSGSSTPPRYAQQLLRAWLPNDSMRDAILGDLHEELVRDAERLGIGSARVRYRQRVAGIVAYIIIDAARWRPWMSTPATVPLTSASLPPRSAARGKNALVGRGDIGLIAAAFGVIGVGIVVNTVLFSTVRHAAGVSTGASITSSALGIASLILALGSAGVAAIMLCVGPRWLRRRACREATARRDAAAAASGVASMASIVVEPQR